MNKIYKNIFKQSQGADEFIGKWDQFAVQIAVCKKKFFFSRSYLWMIKS